MTLEGSIRLLAGTLVLISVAMGYYISPYWFILTAFVGLNLVQSSITGFCPAEMVFSRLFFNEKK
nr:DUF2892 domain-containing protein [candidate division Zixibacteria bacterium]